MVEEVGGAEKRRRGRPKNDPPTVKIHVSMTEEQAAMLRRWGRGDLSAGLRWLVDAVAPMVRKLDEPP